MTERLYYRDSYLREFEAHVLQAKPAEGGRAHAILDQTAFYPTSGGQPFDQGTLNGVPVLDVFEEDEGEVVHVLEKPLEVQSVKGVIDWERRFDHMQQHTGQHVLSAAFVRLFNLPTVSFHLGPDICTIDLKTAALRSKQLRQAEELANQAVFENRPVHIRFAQAEELTERELRKTVSRAGELRLIEVEDFDCCPCGGTHVARTGELGLIFVRSAEKTKGNTRVEFVCGRRALRVARTDHERLQEAARLLTTGAAELPDVIRKQMDERRAGERARKRLLERLAEHEARALLEGAETVGERRVVCRMMEEADGGWLRLLAARLVKQPGVQLLLGGKGKPAAVVFAQSPGLPADMNALLRETVGKLGGKGGGSRDFAQGSVPSGSELEEALVVVLLHLKG